jgi:hypothetical protein
MRNHDIVNLFELVAPGTAVDIIAGSNRL